MRKSPTTLIIVGFVLLVILGSGAIYLAWRWDQQRDFERLWDEYLAAGGPASFADITFPDVPDEQNAAVHYQHAWADHEQWREGEIDRSGLVATISGENQENPMSQEGIDELLDRYAASLEAIIEASALEKCVWDAHMFRDVGYWDVRLPWLSPAHAAGLLLGLRAAREFDAGLNEQAIRSLTAMLRLGDHLAEPPLIITLILRAGLQDVAMGIIEQSYFDGGRPDESLIRAIKAIDPRTGGRRALLLDGQVATLSREQIEEGIRLSSAAGMGLPLGWNEYRDRALVLEIVLHNANLFEIKPPQRLEAFREQVDQSWSVLAHLFIPEISHFDRRLSRVEVRRELALVAFDLREYREVHGWYPDPDDWPMPRDPVTGRPLHYERTDDGGFILKSDSEFRGERIIWTWQ